MFLKLHSSCLEISFVSIGNEYVQLDEVSFFTILYTIWPSRRSFISHHSHFKVDYRCTVFAGFSLESVFITFYFWILESVDLGPIFQSLVEAYKILIYLKLAAYGFHFESNEYLFFYAELFLVNCIKNTLHFLITDFGLEFFRVSRSRFIWISCIDLERYLQPLWVCYMQLIFLSVQM